MEEIEANLGFPVYMPVAVMALILDGNSEHVAHEGRKMSLTGEENNPICDYSRYNQMLYIDQITIDCSLRAPLFLN